MDRQAGESGLSGGSWEGKKKKNGGGRYLACEAPMRPAGAFEFLRFPPRRRLPRSTIPSRCGRARWFAGAWSCEAVALMVHRQRRRTCRNHCIMILEGLE